MSHPPTAEQNQAAVLEAAPRVTRLRPHDAAEHLLAAMRLAWQAAPHAIVVKVLLVIVGGTGPVAAAWLTKTLIDRLTIEPASGGPNAGSPLLMLAVTIGLVGLVLAVDPYMNNLVDGVLQRTLRLLVTSRLYRAVSSFAGLARLENPRFQDRLQLAMSAGRTGPTQAVLGGLAGGQGALSALGFIGSLLMVAPFIVPMVLVAAVPLIWVEIRLSSGRATMTWRIGHAERREAFYRDLLASLDAAKEVRLFGLGDFFGGRLVRELKQINREEHALDRRETKAHALLTILGSALTTGGLIWVVMEAAAGRLTVGDIALFVAAAAGFQGGVQRVISSAARVHHGLLLFDHYRVVMNAPKDLSGPAHPPPPPPLEAGIEFRNVWFRYTDEQDWVLRDVNLTIPARHAVALVGVNGSGKSTLVKLLCRFYDPVHGQILWDGHDLRELDVYQLRERVSAVFQDFMAYDLSAAENVGVGDTAVMGDRTRIAEAARLADCHLQLAALPHGYDTVLSRMFYDGSEAKEAEMGVLLSGGMWQRVAVARALVRGGRDLLILDEPSAGLDAEAEYQIHQTLRTLRSGRTSLLISHRLSTIRDADIILVLDDGVVVEQGTHDALMANDEGRYARLFSRQASGYQLVGGDLSAGRHEGQ